MTEIHADAASGPPIPTPSASAGIPALMPPARRIDPRGQRFGAGVSVVVLGIAFATGSPWLVALLGLDLAISAACGTRFFLPSRPWRPIRSVLRLAPVEPEHEYPPRFAQAMGATMLGVGSILFLAGFTPIGWIFAAAVAALQALLALTGFCLGCRLYFVRWLVPSLFARAIGRSAGGAVTPIRVVH